MKKIFTAFSMAQSMFCSIPCPFHGWDDTQRKNMLAFLPLVGLEIGLVWFAADLALKAAGIPVMVYALAMSIIPYLMTGFIHLDGFMDVCDAVCSCRNIEKRRAILKDSHVGAFAVIWCIIALLSSFAFFASAEKSAAPLIFVPFVSRCLSALGVLNLKPMATSQYAEAKAPKWLNALLCLFLAAAFGISFALWGSLALCCVAAAAVHLFALYRNVKNLDGMNGDISGFCITTSEIAAVAVWALL